MEFTALKYLSYDDESIELWFSGSIKYFLTMPRLHLAKTKPLKHVMLLNFGVFQKFVNLMWIK